MILLFDYFETIIHTKSMDFNRGLAGFWEKYYKDKCSFEEIKKFGEEQFEILLDHHARGLEYSFIKDELPEYAVRFGGETVSMTPEEEADFLMKCNDMEVYPGMEETLKKLSEKDVPMYVLSNSGFSGEALLIVLDRLNIGHYFKRLWSSADFGRIKPCKEYFDQAINAALNDCRQYNKNDIAFVGDLYETDVVGAFNAGIDIIWFNHENNQGDDAVKTIHNADELLKYVD